MIQTHDYYYVPVIPIPKNFDGNWNRLFYMDKNDINFQHGGSVYTFYLEKYKSTETIDLHTHNFLEMKVFIDAQNLTEVVEGKVFEIHPGDILFTNQREAHYYKLKSGSLKRIMIGFSPSFVDETIHDSGTNEYFMNFNFLEFFFRRDSFFSGRLHLPREAFTRVLVQCLQIVHTSNARYEGTDIMIKNHVLSMLSCLLMEYRSYVPELKKNDRRILTILFYVQNNLAKSLTVSGLAEKFNISASRLYEIFRQRTGATLSHYMNDLRLQKAKSLLRTTQLDVIQVAFDVGFHDISYFHRLFKEKYGTTPLKYRINHTLVQ